MVKLKPRPKRISPIAFVGLDTSLQDTGIVILDSAGELLTSCNVESSPKEPELRRLLRIANSVVDEIVASTFRFDAVVVFMEGHAYGRNTGKAKTRAELTGMVKLMLAENKTSIFVVPPKSLKKVTTGNGNSTKAGMMKAVLDQWGVHYSNDNLADAYALAQYGRKVLLDKERLEYECLWQLPDLQTFARKARQPKK